MCVAVWQPEGKAVPVDILEASVKRNDDGSGILYWDASGKPQVFKTMDPNEFVQQAQLFAGAPALFHCRIATHGTVDENNVHPFVFYPNGDTTQEPLFLMHNGIFQFHLDPKDPNSDTWHFARFLEQQNDIRSLIRNPDWLAYMESFIGSNKVVIADNNGYAAILNDVLGTWRDGIWYSNSLSLPPVKKAYVSTYSWNDKTGKSVESVETVEDTSSWGAEAVWDDVVDPESKIKTSRLAGWRLEDGTFIPVGHDPTDDSDGPVWRDDKIIDDVVKSTVVDAADKFGQYIHRDNVQAMALDLMAGWHGELVDAGRNPSNLADAESIIEWDIMQYEPDVIAHAIFLLMQHNLNNIKVSAPSEAANEKRKLTRQEKRVQRRNKRHMNSTNA